MEPKLDDEEGKPATNESDRGGVHFGSAAVVLFAVFMTGLLVLMYFFYDYLGKWLFHANFLSLCILLYVVSSWTRERETWSPIDLIFNGGLHLHFRCVLAVYLFICLFVLGSVSGCYECFKPLLLCTDVGAFRYCHFFWYKTEQIYFNQSINQVANQPMKQAIDESFHSSANGLVICFRLCPRK